MTNEDLKFWIKDNLIIKNLSYKKTTKQWFIENDFLKIYDYIIDKTCYLNNNCNLKERIYCVLHDIFYVQYCKTCNNKTKFESFSYGYRDFCCIRCSSRNDEVRNRTKQTNIKKYGVENPYQSEVIKDKIKQTNLKKYGAEHVMYVTEIKNKIKQTNIKKYGVCYPNQLEEKKQKMKKTNLKRYGVEYISQSPEIRKIIQENNIKKYGRESANCTPSAIKKRKQTTMRKYGVDHHSQKHISKASIIKLNDPKWLKNEYVNKNKNSVIIAKELGVGFKTILRKLHKFKIEINYNYYQSQFEKEIIEFINNKNVKVNIREIISPYELDIYLPDNKLAIEFDGLFWHSSDSKELNMKIWRKHLLKTELCEKQNIQLLHIFENEWLNPIKQNIWKSIINAKLNLNNKLLAKECEVKEISNIKLVKKFLNNNHSQGFTKSKIKLGLFHKNELVSLMTFRKDKKYQYKVNNYCNKNNIDVVDGASKLFKYFVSTYNPERIISYIDRRYDNGSLYKKLGFEHIYNSKPNYYYFLNNNKMELHYMTSFKKHEFSKILENFDPKLSGIENMFNNNYRLIWDCGNTAYIWNK